MKRCNEAAWWANGQPLAVCTHPYGTEHSHSDLTAIQAIMSGVARPVTDEDTFYVRDDDDSDEYVMTLWCVECRNDTIHTRQPHVILTDEELQFACNMCEHVAECGLCGTSWSQGHDCRRPS